MSYPFTGSGASGLPEVFTGSVTGTATLTFTRLSKSIHIICTDDVDSLLVSVDSGTNWITLGAYGELILSVNVNNIILQSTGTTSYSIVVSLA
jgi:hypothetical protein